MQPAPVPFGFKRENGVLFVESAVDAAFRKALLAGVPASLRIKMQVALAATPQKGARAHTMRYFGAEADAVCTSAAELAQELHRFLRTNYQLDGLLEWLTLTGYGNDYRMVKVFHEWAKMARSQGPVVVSHGEVSKLLRREGNG